MEARLVRGEMREGFAGLHRRLDDLIGRVDQINGRVGKAHDRASKLEQAQHDVAGAIAWLRKKVFSLEARREGEAAVTGDGAHVTHRDLKRFIGVVVGTATFTAAIILWVLRMAGKL